MRFKASKQLIPLVVSGYLFLYLPIMILIIFSFNSSNMITTWTGFSTKWYQALFADVIVLNAFWMSLRIAFISATLSLVLGTLTAVALVRIGKYKGRKFLGTLATSPLVLPDVIMGLALLLLFVSLAQMIGWPSQRGMTTITIAHTTLAFAYVVIIVRMRLLEFDRQYEDAALDLGARPMTVFLHITLPLISPSLVSGWLLSFTLSLDDLVLASFLSGPGTTTLPMYIFSSIRFGLSPKINALATIMILAVALGVGIAAMIIHHTQQKKRRI